MNSDWNDRSNDDGGSPVLVSGAVKMALIFGSAAVAFALIAAPIAERQTQSALTFAGGGVDRMTTGSVQRAPGASTYTIRRSVLQETPNSVCIIRQNGTRSGSC